MALTIALDEEKKIWHPGDPVSGRLVLTPSKQLNVSQVALTLEGLFHAGSSDRSQYVAAYGTDLALFRKKVVLFSGPYTVATAQEWLFTFSFPDDCRNAEKRGVFANPRNIEWFQQELAKSLPPSMMSRESDYSHQSELYSWVRYQLRAEVSLTGIHSDIENTMRLRLMPFRDESHRASAPVHHEVTRQRLVKSAHLNPEIGDRDLSLKEKLKGSFASTPSMSYDVVALFPDQGILGEPPHIVLSVKPHKTDSKEQMPEAVLKSVEIYVIRRGWQQFKQAVTIDRIDQMRSALAESIVAKWEGAAVIEGKVDLRHLCHHKRPFDWMGIVPDFNTFNLFETHTLKLKLEIEVARQTSEIILPGPAFKVLSPFCRPIEDSIPKVSSNICSGPKLEADPMEGDTELPPYEEHPSNSPFQ